MRVPPHLSGQQHRLQAEDVEQRRGRDPRQRPAARGHGQQPRGHAQRLREAHEHVSCARSQQVRHHPAGQRPELERVSGFCSSRWQLHLEGHATGWERFFTRTGFNGLNIKTNNVEQLYPVKKSSPPPKNDQLVVDVSQWWSRRSKTATSTLTGREMNAPSV